MAARTGRKGKSRYRIENWSEYSHSLVNRGKITIWFSEDSINNWHPITDKKVRGGQEKFSSAAIQACLTIRHVFKLAYRQTEGFISSIIELLGSDIKSPNYSTMSRRAIDLCVVSELKNKTGDIDILVDSTGLKVYGAGEWCEEKHGKTKRRQWKKLHIAVDKKTQDIVASILTDEKTSDPSQVIPLLDLIAQNVLSMYGDGVYEGIKTRNALEEKDIKCIAPPPKNASLSKNADTDPTSRDLDNPNYA